MRKMFVFLWLCCGFIGITTAQTQVKISRFQGDIITALDASGAFEITIRQGKETGVTLNIPAHYEKNLVFTDQGGKIKIGFQGRIKEHYKNEKFTAEIVCSSLEEIDLSGACTLRGEGDFTSRNLKIHLTGAAKATFTGRFEATQRAGLELSGASQLSVARLFVPNLMLDASGASAINLGGEAENGKIGLSGASKAEVKDFALKNVELEASGASKCKLNVSESLIAEVSGAAHVGYSGDPKVVPTVSGTASFRKE